ncbi:MAG: TolC family protein [Bacteroidota bacterium]
MKYLSCIILFLAASTMSLAQESFTLQEAIEYAQRNHNDIRSAQLNVEDARFQIRETAAIGIPQLSGEITYNHYLKLKESLVPIDFFDPESETIKVAFGAKNNFAGGLSMSSLVFDFSYIVGLKAAKELKELTQKQLNLSHQQVSNNVRDAYVATFIIQITEETLQKNITNLEKTLYETQQLYENGFVEQLDVDRLELSLSNLGVDLKKLTEQKAVLLNVLKFQMGYPMNDDIVLTDNIETLKQDALSVIIPEGNLDYSMRRELEVFDKQLVLNELNIKRIRAGHYPNLYAFAEYGQYLEGNRIIKNGVWLNSAFIGFQISIPIFDGFQKKNSVARAQVNYEKIKLQKEEVERAIVLQIKNARVDYRNAVESLEATERSLNLAQKIYDTTKIKYQEGVGSSIEVTQAEQSLYQSQANYNNALYDLLLAKMRLDQAVGR